MNEPHFEKKAKCINCGYTDWRLLVIMWTILWTVVCNCLSSFSVQHADSQWNTWIEDTNTIDKYKKIVSLMLSDGHYK